MRSAYFRIVVLVSLCVALKYVEATSNPVNSTEIPAVQIPCSFLNELFSVEDGVWGDGCISCKCELGFAKCETESNCEKSSADEDDENKLSQAARRRRMRSPLEKMLRLAR